MHGITVQMKPMDEKKQLNRTFGPHIVQYSPKYSFCAGCTSCEVVCTLTHDGLVGPQYNRIFLERGTSTMVSKVRACQHCTDAPCYNNCVKKDEAMCIDENGIVYINEENCIGCGKCMRSCVFEPPRINLVKSKDKTKRKAKKCDLCKEREEGPACIEWCPVRCIGLSTESVEINQGELLPKENCKKEA